MWKRKARGLAIIGPEDRFEGTLRAGGDLEIHGRVEGDVKAEGTIRVGAKGVICGQVAAPELVVSGRIEGSVEIHGHLHMCKGGTIAGEASYGSLQVDRGGVIEGRASAAALGEREVEENELSVVESSAGVVTAQA
ncbi:MAG: polymer-forming cytoskeletal protein [Myxococcota bacterium]